MMFGHAEAPWIMSVVIYPITQHLTSSELRPCCPHRNTNIDGESRQCRSMVETVGLGVPGLDLAFEIHEHDDEPSRTLSR